MKRLIELLLRSLAKLYLRRVGSKKIIVVVGSIGKTSTTQAIAHVLRASDKSVVATRHNYNTNLGVPASILSYDLPQKAVDPFAWAWLFVRACLKAVHPRNHVDYFILELGTDKPGDLANFAWLSPDVALITAVAPEHMEFFVSLDKVAKEELSVSSFSSIIVVNELLVDKHYFDYINNKELYHYNREILQQVGVDTNKVQVVGDHSMDALSAAAWIAKHEGISDKEIVRALNMFTPPPGRMRKFNGKYNSVIIDDTYNSSPEAAIAALQHLYTEVADHRIALLGNMNELGDSSQEMHEKLGDYCNKTKLDFVVTLGQDANRYTAQRAEKNGCKVARSDTPQESAEFIIKRLKTYNNNESTVVLCKGSQNGVFAEEAVKMLLAREYDIHNLVRQSRVWHKKKNGLWVQR